MENQKYLTSTNSQNPKIWNKGYFCKSLSDGLEESKNKAITKLASRVHYLQITTFGFMEENHLKKIKT